MRATAARLVEHGRPLRVEAVDLPDPRGDEVLVEMRYAGVNPIERYGVEGTVAPDAPVPRTIGSEGAGMVDGRPVVVRGQGLGTTRDGLWASAAVVPRATLFDVPDGVPLEQAAAVGVAGATAWQTVTEYAGVSAQDRVLVLGATGGVGSIIVPLAKAAGAVVWGQTSQTERRDFVAGRGADHVVVSGADGLADAVSELRPTVVFDPLGDEFTGQAITAIAPHGRLVIFGTSADPNGAVPLRALYRGGITIRGYAGLMSSDQEIAAAMRQLLDQIADGRLDIPIERVLPLAEVNDAIGLLAGRQVMGKVVLDLAG